MEFRKSSYTSPEDGETEDQATSDLISIEHLQRLVRLLDQSDVSELELKRPEEGTRLLLRKARAAEVSTQAGVDAPILRVEAPLATSSPPSPPVARETKHTIVAHLVGIFHRWGKPNGGVLVSAGDRVKVAQLVATIESLNVINEVETPLAGRVVEILMQEGQPVEYGQPLMVIDSASEEEDAIF